MDNEARIAVEMLKTVMVTTPVFSLPNMSESFTIETDASNTRIKVVLTQGGHHINFISKGLLPRQQVLSAYESELLSILLGIKKRHFT